MTLVRVRVRVRVSVRVRVRAQVGLVWVDQSELGCGGRVRLEGGSDGGAEPIDVARGRAWLGIGRASA